MDSFKCITVPVKQYREQTYKVHEIVCSQAPAYLFITAGGTKATLLDQIFIGEGVLSQSFFPRCENFHHKDGDQSS